MVGLGFESAFSAEKVFCIGLSKTGTTSLEQALKDLGYRLGDQHQGELLLQEYTVRNFRPIVEFCLTADAFQELRFLFPHLSRVDQSFPNANSSFRSAMIPINGIVPWSGSTAFIGGGRIPTKDDWSGHLSYPGFVWDSVKLLLNPAEEDIYHKPTLVSYYDRHNADVRDYFRSKANFLEINLSDKGAYGRFCDFLGKEPIAEDFPWLNSSLPSRASDRED